MNHSVSRAQLLRGDFNGERGPLRPPWALTETEFVERCDGCGACVPACQDKLIKVGRGKLPEMDFTRGGCDFCRDCLNACEVGALHSPEDDSVPWDIRATIQEGCLSLNAVVCRSCGEVCDQRAIRFKLETGGVARPLLDSELCNGCGACFAVCPVKAVNLSSFNLSRNHAA